MTAGRPSRARPFEAALDQIEDGGFQPRDIIRLIEDASERAAQHQGRQAADRGPDRQRLFKGSVKGGAAADVAALLGHSPDQPRQESSPSPLDVSRRIGCLAIAKTLCTLSSGIASFSASSSGVGSRPISGSI
jgi:hypothetical protein